MKITPKTLNILKNFNTINPSIRFQPGDILRTMSPLQSVLAQAKLDMDVPVKFCISDISQFMNTLGLFEDPEIEVDDIQLTISDGRSKVVYICAAERSIIFPPSDSGIKMPDEPACQFSLTNTDFQQMVRGMAILGLPEVAIVGDGENLYIQGIDSEGRTKNSYRTHIGTTDREYKIIFKPENLKLMPLDYEVKVARVKNNAIVAHFQGKEEEVQYWVAVSKESKL